MIWDRIGCVQSEWQMKPWERARTLARMVLTSASGTMASCASQLQIRRRIYLLIIRCHIQDEYKSQAWMRVQ
jgi:hypothetical protein